MHWARRGLVGLLSLILFGALLGCALSVSAVINLSQPAQIENWLNESKLYDRFVAMTIDQAGEATDSNISSGKAISASDAAVRHAAESAFPPQLLRQSARTFIDSNYAWLEGKTSEPKFSIDLSDAKQNFAEQVGDYVRNYSAGLPVCSREQLVEIQTQKLDLLTAACRPPDSSPDALGNQATQQIINSGAFLADPVITAKTLNPNDDKGGSRPYYEKLDTVPAAYQLGQKMPWILGIVALLSALAIIFLAPRKRRGFRRIGVVFVAVGIILIAIKFVADYGVTQLENRVFNTSNYGQLEKALTDFAHRVEAALVKTDLLFGISLLVLALIIFALLLKTREPKTVEVPASSTATPPAPSPAPTPSAPRRQPVTDILPGPSRPQPPTSPTPKKRPPRPPRLIQ